MAADSFQNIVKLIPVYEKMLLTVLDVLIERYDRDPDYHFIDTKLNIITGQDFYPATPENFFKGKEVIYSWIQGRALEALAGHAVWLKNCSLLSAEQAAAKINRIEQILREIIDSMESIRARNSGRMFFTFSRQGEPLETSHGKLRKLDSIPAASNFSDLFYSKGLLCAASYLGMATKTQEAEQYLMQVVDDIQNRRFITDQQSFDPKNAVTAVPGKHLQGPFMIALSGIAEAARIIGDAAWLEKGREFIEYIFKFHINTGDRNGLRKYDFWEAVDDYGQPWLEKKMILCDPGHALEFVGLSLKCLLQMRGKPKFAGLVDRCRISYPQLTAHCFELGFNSHAGGICKAYDLKSRKPANTDMPWWSLPETIRAAAEMVEFAPESSPLMLTIIEKCSNAFLGNFINTQVHSMAYQTRNAEGLPVDVIPATPDADPGYHTGLSIIAFLDIVNHNLTNFK
jgi:mannose/cellobiose epimerase-like protein (N-acyl-D-glucosamine 2-epimerase family)